MAENGSDFALGYAMGNDSNSGNCGDGFGFGGWGGLIGLLIVASLFGMGGWGMGGFGFGGMGGGMMLNGMATRADINEGFALQGITSGIQSIQNGLCDGFHNMTVGMMNGFNGVDNAICALQHAISDCCCQTQNAIQNVRYDMATQACETRNLIQNVARDITDNQNANYRAMMDFWVQEKFATKDAMIAQLQQKDALNEQSKLFAAQLDAAKAEILRRTGHDYPVASYIVQPPTPVNFPTNGCGTVQWGGYGNGGCGCCAA